MNYRNKNAIIHNIMLGVLMLRKAIEYRVQKKYFCHILTRNYIGCVTKLESFHIALGRQGFSLFFLLTANPMMPRNFNRLISEGDFGPLLENTVSVVTVLAAWKIITNRLILRYDTEVLKNRIIKLREKIKRIFKAESDDLSLLP